MFVGIFLLGLFYPEVLVEGFRVYVLEGFSLDRNGCGIWFFGGGSFGGCMHYFRIGKRKWGNEFHGPIFFVILPYYLRQKI